ncbi:UNVERIFIED_CONTAM: pyruvate dehydrogenase (quinone) [Streptomyces canus]
MSTKVSDHILERLREWGVDHVFGYPGDGINGLLAAWGRADNQPRFVQSRHEEMSAFEAVGYAKFSGRVGVCAATSGPGAIHLLNGLYDAKLDHVPVLAIVGQTHRTAMGGSYQQEVDLHTLFKDVASEFVETVTVPEQLPNVLDRAIRTAYARRCPTAIIIPGDVQELDYSAPTHEFKMVPSSLDRSDWTAVPSQESLERAAEILNSGDKPAILIGQGAAGARAEVERIAELLGAGVAKALLGKDALSDELPYVTGSIGLLGTRPSYELMRDCDTLLTIGSSFPYTQFLPDFGKARGVQIDIDPHMVGLRYPYEVNLVGDAKATLQRLIPMLDVERGGREWYDTVCDNVTRWREVMERRAQQSADPINPEYVARALDPLLPDNAIVTSDSGSTANWYARHLTMRPGMRSSLSGTLATMGPGVPYAIGAKFAHPDRPAIALVGDGAMQMNGMHGRADHRGQVPGSVGGSAADRRHLEQPRPQPGHLGDAGHGGRPVLPALAAAPGRPVRRVRPLPRSDRDPGGEAGGRGGGLAGRSRGGRARGPGVPHRPGRTAHPAARDLGADGGHGRVDPQG